MFDLAGGVPWDAVAAVSTALATVVLIVAAVYAAVQVHEVRVARTLELLLAFHDRYNSTGARRFRRRLFQGQVPAPDALSDDERDALEATLNTLEFVGLLVDRKLLPFEAVAHVFSASPVRVWQGASSYIEASRRTVPSYALFLERLVEKYRRKSPAWLLSTLPHGDGRRPDIADPTVTDDAVNRPALPLPGDRS